MSEAEQNTQRIMTELLAAHACTKRMLAALLLQGFWVISYIRALIGNARRL